MPEAPGSLKELGASDARGEKHSGQRARQIQSHTTFVARADAPTDGSAFGGMPGAASGGVGTRLTPGGQLFDIAVRIHTIKELNGAGLQRVFRANDPKALVANQSFEDLGSVPQVFD